MTARSCCRRGAEAAGWVVPVAVLAVLPKCPACVAAYVAGTTGVGVSLATAASLRAGLMVAAVATMMFVLARRVLRRARERPAARYDCGGRQPMAKSRMAKPRRVILQSMDWESARVRAMVFPDQPFEAAFGDVNDLSWPTHALQGALNWAWVEWHRTGDRSRISEGLAAACDRSAGAVRGKKADPDWRGLHDWLMVACGVLSDSGPTLANAVGSVAAAKPYGTRNQYFEALAGVVTAHLRGDDEAAANQLGLVERSSPGTTFCSPSKALVRSLALRDYVALGKAVEADVRHHWSARYLNRGHRRGLEPLVVSEDQTSIVLNLRGKNLNYYWPYAAAVFAKLALRDGGTVTVDDFWMPLAFVRPSVPTAKGGRRTATGTRTAP